MKQIALVVSLVAAVGGGLLLWIYKQRFEAEAIGGAKVSILVAKTDLGLGVRLEKDNVTTRLVPQAYVERRDVRADEAKQVVGTRVRTKIRAGEAILWTDLATSGARSRDLAGLVLPGMRGFAIPASSSLTFDGLLRPGDRVDVLLTVLDPKTRRPVTRPVLQNLIVLALGSHIGGVTTTPSGNFEYSTVTVAVKPKQAEILASAMREGPLSIALRNTQDVRVLDTTGTTPGASTPVEGE